MSHGHGCLRNTSIALHRALPSLVVCSRPIPGGDLKYGRPICDLAVIAGGGDWAGGRPVGGGHDHPRLPSWAAPADVAPAQACARWNSFLLVGNLELRRFVPPLAKVSEKLSSSFSSSSST